jgi:hypothetical protein
MAIVYNTTLKNTRMTDVVTALDGGGAAGKLNIYTAAYGVLLAQFNLNFSPAGTVAGGILSFSGLPKSTTGLAAGVAAIAKFVSSTPTDIANDLTVGTVGTNIIIDNTNIAIGQTINWTAGTITHG